MSSSEVSFQDLQLHRPSTAVPAAASSNPDHQVWNQRHPWHSRDCLSQRKSSTPAPTPSASTSTTGSTSSLKNKFKENIPAFTIGGPVFIPHLYNGRDKTFFFGAGQWDRFSQNSTTTFGALPTAAGVATLQALAGACPNVATFLGLLGPSRGSPSAPAPASSSRSPCPRRWLPPLRAVVARVPVSLVQVGQFVRNNPEIILDNNHLIRIDHAASQKQNLMFRWLYDDTKDS